MGQFKHRAHGNDYIDIKLKKYIELSKLSKYWNVFFFKMVWKESIK